MNMVKPRPIFYLLSLSFAVTTMLCAASPASYGAALLNVQGKGMAPNQTVILSTGPKQQLRATTASDGSVSFRNLKYSPETNLSFTLSYQVRGSSSKIIPNSILIDVDPFIGTVRLRGSATKAASVILNMAGEDSYAMVANQSGYFAGSADSVSGFSDGKLNVVTNIINVEENCCPRTMKPYLPVSISISGQPEKKADISLIRTNEVASFEISLPGTSYGVSVPDKLIKESWITGVHNLSNNLVESAQRQTSTLGTFLQSQLNTGALRKLQEQEVNITKNYLPSEQVCRYGTLNQGLAASEMSGKANKTALMSSLLANEMKSTNSVVSGKNPDQDKDVDYANVIDAPLTINANFTGGAAAAGSSDILAMAERLFPSRPANKGPDQSNYIDNNAQFRSLQAIRSVAKNTFIAQVAEKSQGTAGSYGFISKLMQSMNFSDAEAKAMMGENPSYYAQMEVLTKKVFQDPAFYINLVDTPANVKRQKASIRAIKLQQQNDFAQVVKRREMLLATLLELKIRERESRVEQRLNPTVDKKSP